MEMESVSDGNKMELEGNSTDDDISSIYSDESEESELTDGYSYQSEPESIMEEEI